MKKNYRFLNQKRGLSLLALVVILGFVSMSAMAQDQELNWTGATDSDATNPTNWDPAASPLENFLNVDSAYKFTNLPELTLTGDNTIRTVRVNATGLFTFTDAGNFLDLNDGASLYLDGGWLIEAGNVSVRKNLYLENPEANVTLTGGSLEARSYLLMGDRNGVAGGSILLSGDSRLHCRVAPGRFSNDTTLSVITITEDAWMEVRGDWVADAEFYIGRNQITSDDNFDPFAYYDVDNALTVIDLRSKDELFLESEGTVQVLVDEAVPTIHAVDNRGFQNLVSKEWKYAETSGGPYMSFDPAQDGDSLYNAVFSAAGTYFVVLTGNDGTNDIMSDEVQVAVTSPMVTLDPVNEQIIREGFTGGAINATFMETPSSVEWKYTTTSGSDYMSFDPAVTVETYTPDFETENIYYVVCEAVVDGVTYLSPEVTIKVVAKNSTSITIDWTGAYSNDAADNRNYEPMTHPWYNYVVVPSRDWIDNPPTLSTEGNDTIRNVWCADSSSFVINKPETDTLTFNGDSYQNGYIVIESGIVAYTGGYFRLDHQNSGLIIKNNAQFLHDMFTGGFIIGKNENTDPGGQVVIQDNGYMKVHHIWRWAADSTMSVITITDNGMLELVGDQISDIAYRVDRNQIKSEDGFVIEYALKVVDQDTTTIVTAKSEVAFDITPQNTQYVGIDLPTDELSTINDETITSREWKYTTTSGEGYVTFDPAQTGETLSATFDAAGTYYVICEGSDGTDTYMSDEVTVNVVSVEISPVEDQEIVVFTDGDLLTVTESVVPDSREWKFSETQGSGYAAFSPARLADTYTPFFTETGMFYVVCESVYEGKGIVSNEVLIEVIEETNSVEEFTLPVDVYPNPSDGKFYLNVASGATYHVAVYDVTGRFVMNEEFINPAGPQEIVIDKSGLYFIKVTQGDAVSTRKIVVN